MSESEVLNRIGDYRVVLHRDPHPEEPDGDGYTPIIRASNGRGWKYEAVNPQARNVADALNRAAFHSFPYQMNALEMLERYLRIFHGALKVQTYGPSPYTDDYYIAFDTEAWRELVGNPDTSSEDYLTDYRAYLEGEVYTWTIERRREWIKLYTDGAGDAREVHEEWTPVELLPETAHYEPGGVVYGEEWAKGEANEDFGLFRRDILGIPEVGTTEEVSWGDINRLKLAAALEVAYYRPYENLQARWRAVADEAIKLIQSTD